MLLRAVFGVGLVFWSAVYSIVAALAVGIVALPVVALVVAGCSLVMGM